MHYDLIQVGAAAYPHLDQHETVLGEADDYASRSIPFCPRALMIDPNRDGLESQRERCGNPAGWTWLGGLAIGPEDGMADIFVPTGTAEYPGINNRRWEIASFDLTFASGRECVRESVSIKTVATIANEHEIHTVDRLVVDVEGMDDKIVRWFIEAGVFPKVIIWEYINLGDRRHRLAEFLSKEGYIHTTISGKDRLSIKS